MKVHLMESFLFCFYADLDDCRKAVACIKQEALIAVAIPGVNKDWPISIVVVGTLDGNTYVFDVLENGKEQNKKFFNDIGLEEVLTSSDITKMCRIYIWDADFDMKNNLYNWQVMCNCQDDSVALFFQFGIKLSTVFDIKVAENVIREHTGRVVTYFANPLELHNKYTGQWVEQDTYLKIKWKKSEGNFWMKRPLAKEKIDHACSRVLLFIKGTYQCQKRYLKENILLEIFQECVKEELEYEIYEEQNKRKRTKESAIKEEVMADVVESCMKGQSNSALINKDKKSIFNSTNIESILRSGCPQIVLDLKKKMLSRYLDHLEKEMNSQETFYPTRNIILKLNEITFYRIVELKDRTTKVKKRCLEIYSCDLQTLYEIDASVEDLSRHDTYIIRALRPYDDSWPYPKIIMDLYWKVVEKDIDKNRENMYVRWMWVGSINTLMFYLDHPKVPLSVRRKIKDIVDAVIERLPQKYGMQNTADEVDDVEKGVLGTLDVTRDAYDPVVERLYWEVAYAMLCDKSNVIKVNQLFPNQFKFLATDYKVPRAVQRKANEILRGLLPLRHF